jgi:hypothetical protein
MQRKLGNDSHRALKRRSPSKACETGKDSFGTHLQNLGLIVARKRFMLQVERPTAAKTHTATPTYTPDKTRRRRGAKSKNHDKDPSLEGLPDKRPVWVGCAHQSRLYQGRHIESLFLPRDRLLLGGWKRTTALVQLGGYRGRTHLVGVLWLSRAAR